MVGVQSGRRSKWSTAVACLALNGCLGGPPNLHYYQAGVGYYAPGYPPQVTVAPWTGDPRYQGKDYCRNLEMSARSLSLAHEHLGVAAGLASVIAVGTGTTLTAIEDSPSPGRKAADLSLPLLGAALAYVAIMEFARAKDADDLESAAATALQSTHDDATANDLCLAAHGAWDSSRSSASKGLADKLANLPATGATNANAPKPDASSNPSGEKR